MAELVLQIVILTGAIVPGWLALAGAWRRFGPGLAPSETILAGAVSLPALLNIEVVVLGLLPVHRPLDSIRWVHAGLCILALGVAWWLRSDVRAVVRGTWTGLTTSLRTAGLGVGTALALGLASQLAASAWGVYNTPWSIDELAYHLPQALQMWQDGRLGPVAGNRIWIDSYPRGAGILYFWTIGLTGSDAGVHGVNGIAGFVLMLAAYCGCRRLGTSARWALLGAAVVPTAPIVFYLSSIGYIDLMVGCLIGSATVFAMPDRDGRWTWPSFLACLVCLLMALWMKFPAVVPTGVILGLRGLVSLGEAWRAWRTRSAWPRPGPVGIALAGGGMLALASIPYVRTWLVYGTPTYPVKLRVGPVVLFNGPMDTALFGRDNALPLVERLTRFWTGWFEPISTDSPGTLGPLFLLAMIPATVMATVAAASGWRTRPVGWLIALAVFWMVPLTPEHHVPRYGLYALLVGACAIAWVGHRLEAGGEPTRGAARGWVVLALGLSLFNVYLSARELKKMISWQAGYGLPMFTGERNRAVRDLWGRLNAVSPTHATVQALQRTAKPGDLVATSVDGMMGVWYDGAYSYRVEHRPAAPWPYQFQGYTNLDHGLGNQAAWLARQAADRVMVAMVYKGSVEDRALEGTESGFELVYEQPAEDGPVVRIWRRRRP
jgi:hypothetical protein